MSDEKSFLQAIKEAGISFPDILGLLKKEGIIPDLKTAEEIAAEKVKADKKAKKKEKKKPKEEPDETEELELPEAEFDKDKKSIDDKFKDMENKLKKMIKDGLKIPGKTPSEGEKRDEDKLPDGVKPSTITTNKFEVRV